jgi:hypothetical protein
MAASAVTAKECLQSAEACLALAHKTKELDTRAALLEIAYEFRTEAKRRGRGESNLPIMKNNLMQNRRGDDRSTWRGPFKLPP